jgi:hypothetical protein
MAIDARLIELERSWHEADEKSRQARAGLAASNRLTTAETLAISTRFEEAELLKKSIINQIEALEETVLVV